MKPKKRAARKTQNKARKKLRRKTQKKIKKKAQRKAAKKIRKKAYKKTQKRPKKTLKKKKIPTHPTKSLEKPAEKEIGVVTHYFNKISVGIIKLKTGLKAGDEIHIKGVHDDFTQLVTSMQLNHKDISYAPKGAEVGIKVIQRVHENDKVYRMAEK